MPQIPLSRIKLDQQAQPRSALNTTLTAEYAEAMKAGAQFPPLTVFHDGKVYWLADGFHRHYAASSIGTREIACVVKPGGLRDAILHSCQANAVHGLRRSDEDKRRAVKVLLGDKEWASWSDREIARRCHVSHTFVAQIREDLKPLTGNVASEKSRKSGKFEDVGRTYRTKHGSVSTMKTPAIGARRQEQESGSAKARSDRPNAPEEVAHYAAVTVLARSICDVRATAEQIAQGCVDEEEREDLREACEGASEKLAAVLLALSRRQRKAA